MFVTCRYEITSNIQLLILNYLLKWQWGKKSVVYYRNSDFVGKIKKKKQ